MTLQNIAKIYKLLVYIKITDKTLLYRKFPKYSDTQNICCNHSKIWTMRLYHRVMRPNDADGMANSDDPDQTAPLGAVWSGSALFAQAYLSENLESLRYYIFIVCVLILQFDNNKMSPVKWICIFEHSVMTNFNCACPATQRGQGSGFLSEGSSWLTACMSEQRRFWRDCADAQARLNLRCSHRR